MVRLTRYLDNPIVVPDKKLSWQREAVFNGCVVKKGQDYHLVYRAQSAPRTVSGKTLELSTIGYAHSLDRVEFSEHRQLIVPEFEWERFGCEDPRITWLDGVYYIYYTAISHFPPEVSGIKVALAMSRDLKTVSEKHIVTPFNAKAMALFPEKIAGKMTAVLTVHTDQPPAKICLVQVDRPENFWDKDFWEKWYAALDAHTLPLLRSTHDHIEVGAPPVKTPAGWLLIYSYIRNYITANKIFGIEAVLLDFTDPTRIIGRTEEALLTPQTEYELQGKVSNVIFPSGALTYQNELGVYYGAADTSICLATVNLEKLLELLTPRKQFHTFSQVSSLKRFSGNPIITPILEHSWEDQYAFNPAAVYQEHKVHLLYRAMGKHFTSVLGYAASADGVHVSERLNAPAYMPREEFERKIEPGYSGCEDPRLTQMGDTLYMCYTAYDGKHPPRVAFTSITVADFCAHRWNWTRPQVISPPGVFDKNACLFPEKIDGKYAFFHRIHHEIWIDFVDDLDFRGSKWLGGEAIIKPKPRTWYSEKIGIGPPPIKTPAGWLLICHGLSREDNKYRLGAALLNLANPAQVEILLEDPILSPHAAYENEGLRPGTVFACGAVVMNDNLLVYYGAADQVVCVASIELSDLLNNLLTKKLHK